eukprot:scaffold80298_cov45-Prasinocladus_malaysianus.AAC.2
MARRRTSTGTNTIRRDTIATRYRYGTGLSYENTREYRWRIQQSFSRCQLPRFVPRIVHDVRVPVAQQPRKKKSLGRIRTVLVLVPEGPRDTNC